MIRVLIADDEALIRAGFTMVLESESDLDVVAEAADGKEAVQMARELRPDVVLMDIRMPEMNGIEAAREILRDAPELPRIIMLTTFDRDQFIYEALRIGASGFLLKTTAPERLVEAVRRSLTGESLFAPEITTRLVEGFVTRPAPGAGDRLIGTLTDRERDVLLEVAVGRSNSEIAASLHLTEATVKTYVARMLPKLGLRDRVQLVVFAYEHGLVVPGRLSARGDG